MNLRRNVIRLALYGLLILNFRVEAQQPKNLPRIGYLTAGSASVAALNVEAFRHGLQQLGYVEGKNIFIEWRYADGKRNRLQELAVAVDLQNKKMRGPDEGVVEKIDAKLASMSHPATTPSTLP